MLFRSVRAIHGGVGRDKTLSFSFFALCVPVFWLAHAAPQPLFAPLLFAFVRVFDCGGSVLQSHGLHHDPSLLKYLIKHSLTYGVLSASVVLRLSCFDVFVGANLSLSCHLLVHYARLAAFFVFVIRWEPYVPKSGYA